MMIRFLLLALVACGAGRSQTAVGQLLEQKALAGIRLIDESLDGVLGVAAIDLTTGQTLGYHADTVFPQASGIKIPILIEMYRAARAGQLQFSGAVTLVARDAVGGDGELKDRLKRGPVTITIGELVRAMIETSDNTATNQCIRLVGIEAVNRTMHELGFSFTRLRRVMMDAAAARRDEENVSTPLEMARLAELLYRGKVVDEQASKEMIGLLKLARGAMRAAVPANIEVAAKPGSVPGVFTETGIVFHPKRPFALSVQAAYLAAGKNPVAGVTRAIYQYFDRLAGSNRYGHRVE